MNDTRDNHTAMSTTFHDSSREFSESAWRNIKPSKRVSKGREQRDPFWTILATAALIVLLVASACRVL